MKKIFTLFLGLISALPLFAQGEEIKKISMSGYIQTQFQWGEEYASMKVGTVNENPEESFSRLGIRRGRIKFTYEATTLTSAVFQLDFTEKGVGFKDAYLSVKAPWTTTVQLKAGIFDRPFGNEISYSSSRRESPERSLLFQTLFPDERDLGAALVLQPSKDSPWNIIKLEAGLFAGNGIKPETDNRRDFIGHLSALRNWDNISLGGGVSYYNGGVYQSSADVFTMKGDHFVLDDSPANKGKFAKREYLGADIQFTARTAAGATQLRAEYITGQQPGTATSSKSPNYTTAPVGIDTYIRPFEGWYAIFVQDMGKLPLSLVAKYDYYDPNTDIEKNQAGADGAGSLADLSYNTFGFGALWRVSNSVRLQAFYESVKNEASEYVEFFTTNRKDNLFTLRLQYSF